MAYDGAPFHGWQKQLNAHTVQDELEAVLSLVLQEKIDTTGCGRTDTGVHASSFYAHFETNQVLDKDKLVYKLNKMLPPEIALYRIFKVADDFHARFSAKQRSYQYFLHHQKSPFHKDHSWLHLKGLDVDKMNQAAQYLIGEHDFSSFCKSGAATKTNLCDVTFAQWTKQNDQLRFDISANRFLRNMVRTVVGTLVEIGEGKREVDSIVELMQEKSRAKAGVSAPGHALFLSKVEYDWESLNS